MNRFRACFCATEIHRLFFMFFKYENKKLYRVDFYSVCIFFTFGGCVIFLMHLHFHVWLVKLRKGFVIRVHLKLSSFSLNIGHVQEFMGPTSPTACKRAFKISHMQKIKFIGCYKISNLRWNNPFHGLRFDRRQDPMDLIFCRWLILKALLYLVGLVRPTTLLPFVF